MDFYNFFSFSAKKAIYRASEVCIQFNNQYLEPEHAFYSILNVRTCSAVQVLHQLGVNLPKLTYSVEAYLYEHAGNFRGSSVFSQRTITLLDTAYKEVKRLNHKEIGTTHLLIALTQDRGEFLKSLFQEHGLDSKRLRDTYLTHLKGYADSSGIEIKRGWTEKIVPPVHYDETVKQILKNAEFTAQSLGCIQLTPAHLLYSSCLYAIEWWDQFGAAGIEPHAVSGKLARLMRKGCPQQGERLALSPGACDVFGRAYGLTLRSGQSTVRPAYFLQAVLESDDAQIAEVFADAPDARGKLIEMLESGAHDTLIEHAPEPGESGHEQEPIEGGFERISQLLNMPPTDDSVEDSENPFKSPDS